MEAEAKANLLYRLSCIEGHLRAVKRMVDEDRPCPEVVQQTRALQGSLRQVSVLLVTNHLDHCLRTDATEGQYVPANAERTGCLISIGIRLAFGQKRERV